jgi:hypothetical protein
VGTLVRSSAGAYTAKRSSVMSRPLPRVAQALLAGALFPPMAACSALLGDFTLASDGGDASVSSETGVEAGAPDASSSADGDATMGADAFSDAASAADAANMDARSEAGSTDAAVRGDTGLNDAAAQGETGAGCAASCTTGCCDSTGACIAYADQTAGACGSGGGACAPCTGGQECDLSSGQCVCSVTTTFCNGACVNVAATDENNCGSCGHGCQGGACDGGLCQPTALAPSTSPSGIAVNESNVYWAESAGNLKRIPVAGTTPSTLYADSTSTLNGSVALSSTNVYFAVDTSEPGSAVQATLLGGSGSSQFDFTAPPSNVATFTLDATNLYVSLYDPAVQGGGCSAGINVVPLNQGNPITSPFQPCTVARIAVDANNIYWTDSGPPNGLAPPSVEMQPLAASSPAKQIALAQHPFAIAILNGTLYWSDTVAGMIMSYAVGGTAAPSPIGVSTSPTDMAVDSSGVYWIDSNATVLHVPLTGGSPKMLATQQAGALAIATNSTSIFWVDQGTSAHAFADGAVMKLAK